MDLWYFVLSMVWHHRPWVYCYWLDKWCTCKWSILFLFGCSTLFPEYSGYCAVCDLSVCQFLHALYDYLLLLSLLFNLCAVPRCFPSSTCVFLHWASTVATCNTWQQMASSTMRDSTEHDSLCPHCQFVLPKKEKKGEREKILLHAWSEMDWFQRFLSCQIAVKLSSQIYCWFVLIESRSTSVRYTLKKVLYAIYFLDIWIECLHSSFSPQ